ncbi:MAG: hypothetical protein MUF47_03175 [Porphyrobacter sp.]|jgi:hypothetical protein|nr:hypothetical protein [Porphyrobacter sp.]
MSTLTRARPALSLRPLAWGAACLLLAVPLVAMQFTSEVNWGAEDFAAAALLIGGLGLAIELAVARVQMPVRRFAAIALAVFLFLAIWAELAVGIFG